MLSDADLITPDCACARCTVMAVVVCRPDVLFLRWSLVAPLCGFPWGVDILVSWIDLAKVVEMKRIRK